jgi:RNA polymerase sigma factor (sigma-70 family)
MQLTEINDLILDHLHIVDTQVALFHRRFRLPGFRIDYDDVEGLAYLALVLAAHAFDPEKGIPFGAWANLCVRGRLLNMLTKINRRKRKASMAVFDDFENVEDRTDAQPDADLEARDEVEKLRRTLPDRWASICLDYYGHGKTLVEVARRHGLSRGRVQQIASEAIDRAQGRRPARSRR